MGDKSIMFKKLFLITGICFVILSFLSAAAEMKYSVEVVEPLALTRFMPSIVGINEKFDVNLTLRNVVDMEFVALTIKERIPPGYSIKDIKKINPQPSSIGEENGATVIYWNIDRFRNYTIIYFKYSLSAPKVSGNNNFSAEVIGFDIAGNRYIAKNEMSQTVRKKSMWQIILEFFGM